MYVLKVILKMMARKMIQCFIQLLDILKQLLTLVKLNHGNLKDCVMRILNLHRRLIINKLFYK